LSSHIKK